jgi:hypothetical protein
MTDRFDSRKFSKLQRLFGRIFCPECEIKMKEINWPYHPGYECPKCKWVTWVDLAR